MITTFVAKTKLSVVLVFGYGLARTSGLQGRGVQLALVTAIRADQIAKLKKIS